MAPTGCASIKTLTQLLEVSTMRYQKHFDHWTVLYASGHKAYFKSEEDARSEAVLYGIGLVSPLYY